MLRQEWKKDGEDVLMTLFIEMKMHKRTNEYGLVTSNTLFFIVFDDCVVVRRNEDPFSFFILELAGNRYYS